MIRSDAWEPIARCGRPAGIVMSQAVLIAIGIDWDGRRQVLAVEMANREGSSSWKGFLLSLKARDFEAAVRLDCRAQPHEKVRRLLNLSRQTRDQCPEPRNGSDITAGRMTMTKIRKTLTSAIAPEPSDEEGAVL